MTSASAQFPKHIKAKIDSSNSHQSQIKSKTSDIVNNIKKSNLIILSALANIYLILRIGKNNIWLSILGLSFGLLWLAISWLVGEERLAVLLFLFLGVELVEFQAQEDEEQEEDAGAVDADVPDKCQHEDIGIGCACF